MISAYKCWCPHIIHSHRFFPLPYLKNAHAKPCLVNHFFIYDLSVKSTINFCLEYHVKCIFFCSSFHKHICGFQCTRLLSQLLSCLSISFLCFSGLAWKPLCWKFRTVWTTCYYRSCMQGAVSCWVGQAGKVALFCLVDLGRGRFVCFSESIVR